MSFSNWQSSRLILSAIILATAAGCAPVDPGMGEAVKYDMLAQTVNPDPVYPANALQAGSSGTHGAKAAERYRKDQVKPIERESTSKGSSSGGSAGAASGTGPK